MRPVDGAVYQQLIELFRELMSDPEIDDESSAVRARFEELAKPFFAFGMMKVLFYASSACPTTCAGSCPVRHLRPKHMQSSVCLQLVGPCTCDRLHVCASDD